MSKIRRSAHPLQLQSRLLSEVAETCWCCTLKRIIYIQHAYYPPPLSLSPSRHRVLSVIKTRLLYLDCCIISQFTFLPGSLGVLYTWYGIIYYVELYVGNYNNMLISIPVLPILYVRILIREPCAYMRGNNYSTVGVNEQKDMVNSGVRGTKDKNLRSGCIGKLRVL
jgi:hypothetical protein